MIMYLQNVIASKKFFIITFVSLSNITFASDLNSWDCYKLEGAKIIAEDGTYLGKIEDNYDSDSIYNKYSEYGNSYSSNSIWNEYSDYGNEYSSQSALNDNASEPPVLLKDGEIIGKLTTKKYAYDGYDVNKIKKTCDW